MWPTQLLNDNKKDCLHIQVSLQTRFTCLYIVKHFKSHLQYLNCINQKQLLKYKLSQFTSVTSNTLTM